ncbi:hypothetical protein [Brevibacillus nitrificans]|uniref:hypothetical protein n=1 Tax=Brevibacillus nitrificans TaxID=651560 RepID=UPI002862C2A5|nr:hypothetical protein [Brevibacillus nitrificans]MDR7314705.1 hypothetical protein [Brevibacillus nitrificans]
MFKRTSCPSWNEYQQSEDIRQRILQKNGKSVERKEGVIHMKSKYDELFSSLGYDSVDVILGINPRLISETETKKLVRLIFLSEKNKMLASEIETVLTEYPDCSETKLKLLLQIENSYDPYYKAGSKDVNGQQ